jgi:hypothetical protein
MSTSSNKHKTGVKVGWERRKELCVCDNLRVKELMCERGVSVCERVVCVEVGVFSLCVKEICVTKLRVKELCVKGCT